MIITALLSAAVSATLASIKNSRDTDVKIAVLENTICVNKENQEKFEEATTSAIAEIAKEMKAAARELLQAASDVKSMSQTQSIVNSVTTKALDALTIKVETHGSTIAEIKGCLDAIRSNSKNNHSQ